MPRRKRTELLTIYEKYDLFLDLFKILFTDFERERGRKGKSKGGREGGK